MHPASTTSRPVRLLIAEFGLDVDEELVDLMTGAHHQEPFATFNPNRLVPVLEDGDMKLTESSAILKYLADKYDLPVYPKDLKTRAKVNEVMDWVNSNFYRDWGYNLVYPQLFPHHTRPSEEGQKVTLEWGRAKSQFWLQVMNDYWLAGGKNWLVGDSATIADYFAGSVVAAGDLLHIDFSKYPNVKKWLANVKGIKNWGKVSEQLDGFAASLAGKEFVRP